MKNKKVQSMIQAELQSNPAISQIVGRLDEEIQIYDLRISDLKKNRSLLLDAKRKLGGGDARHNRQKRSYYIERQKRICKMYFEMLMPNRAIAEELGMKMKALESQITKLRRMHPEAAAARDARVA